MAVVLLVVPVLLVSAPASAQTPAASSGFVEGEKTLQGRLLAPCCWNQTIDIHDSEVTRQLRAEIRQRLVNGESPASIEQDMVARYGERIRAVPAGKSLTGMGVWLSVLFGVAGLGAAALVVRWVRRARGAKGAEARNGASGAAKTARGDARDKWDDRLDDELRDVED